MASLNKVMLIGNLTRDPELRYTPGGQAVCDFSIAINRRYTINGQEREEVCFVDIVVWSKQAESCGKYIKKGATVFVDGRLRNDNWEDKEGKKRSRLRVTAERVQFLSSLRTDSAKTAARVPPQPPADISGAGGEKVGVQQEPLEDTFDSGSEPQDDNIPF